MSAETKHSESDRMVKELEKTLTMEHVEALQTLPGASHLLKGGVSAEAVEAENNEHQMGVWEAFKTFPKASFWALVMCFTIVSSRRSQPVAPRADVSVLRSWSRTRA
jgi:hypothetical protein